MQTAAGAAHAALESGKRKRQEKLKRERAAAKKRDDAAAALAEKASRRRGGASEGEGGAGLVGWRVRRVFWKAENAWFYGTVKTFDAASGKHAVAYDDGDEQTLALRGPAAALGFLRAPRRKNGAKRRRRRRPRRRAPRPARQRARPGSGARRAPPAPRGGFGVRTAYARPRRRGGSVRRSPTRRSARDR